MGSLFNDAKYSDATVRIHDVALPVHKIIICLQTEYFEKAFRKEFVEGSSGTITFSEGSGAAYWRVFEYLYTGDYLGELSTDKFEGALVTVVLRLLNNDQMILSYSKTLACMRSPICCFWKI